MPKVDVRGSEVRLAIIRFKRLCDKLGTLKGIRENSHEVKATTQRKKDKDAAVKRLKKKLFKEEFDLEAAKKASRNRKRKHYDFD
jgi:small subunit ribosomal protein S21